VDVSEGPIREIVSAVEGIDDPSVVRYGEAIENEYLVKFKGEIKGGDASEGKDKVETIELALSLGIGPLSVQRVEFVGPRVGEELRTNGLLALFWASIVVLVYIAVRFSSRFAPGAIIAVLHDLLITAGIFVMLGLEFDLRILAAMLAILGYSLNDTIIIYDRIRENMATHTKHDLPEVLNLSVNQTLSRTVLTSGTTLMTLAALYFLGGEVIRPFAFAMVLGVLVGTYSSIFIASPTLLLLETWLADGGKKA
jgi:preprotein translocase subunit SecF